MGFGLHCQVLFQSLKPEVPCGYCTSSLKKRQLVSKPVGVVVVLSIKLWNPNWSLSCLESRPYCGGWRDLLGLHMVIYNALFFYIPLGKLKNFNKAINRSNLANCHQQKLLSRCTSPRQGVFPGNPKDFVWEDWGTLGNIRGITTPPPETGSDDESAQLSQLLLDFVDLGYLWPRTYSESLRMRS